MLYRILFHICWLIISFVIAAVVGMALYTYGAVKLVRSFWVVFGVLELLHAGLAWRGQFSQKQRALLLNNIHFGLLMLAAGFVVYFYANVSSFRNEGDNSIEFRYFSYFFDNIFLVNLVIFIVNLWFLCRGLLAQSFRQRK